MRLSAILAPLIAAKVPHEIIMQTVQAWELEQSGALEKRRESDRLRQAKQREKTISHVMSRDVTVTVPSHVGASYAGSNTLSSEPKGSSEVIERKIDARAIAPLKISDLEAFKAVLAPHTEPERLAALVKHRTTKRAQNTEHSARLIIAVAQNCKLSVSEAIDTMIERNWVSIKPEWLENSKFGGQGAPPRRQTPADAMAEHARTGGNSTVKGLMELFGDLKNGTDRTGPSRDVGGFPIIEHQC